MDILRVLIVLMFMLTQHVTSVDKHNFIYYSVLSWNACEAGAHVLITCEPFIFCQISLRCLSNVRCRIFPDYS
jgi:hypothetical protein